MRRALLILACLTATADARGDAGVQSSLATIRPTDPVTGAASASISAARNEIESFQVAIGGPRENVTVRLAGPLKGPGGTIPPSHVRIYRAAYYDVREPSDLEGAAGRWPDALIPAVDPIYHERRRAFPVDIPAGENRVVWVDVHVPPGQAAGVYHGRLDIHGARDVGIRLRVRDFELPSTTTLDSAFGMAGRPCNAHYGLSCSPHHDRTWRIKALYVRAALENRVTISTPAYEPPRRDLRGRFRRFVEPFIDGTGRGILHGARLTTLQIYPSDPLRAWKRAAAAGGFSGRAFLYACDEPEDVPERWASCLAATSRARRAWPRLPALITASVPEAQQFGALAAVDIIVPLVNMLDELTGSEGDGRRLWTYLACRSHGCEGDAGGLDPYWRGWPSYAIDQPGSSHRAMGVLAFLYGVTGELYFDTTYDLETAWTDQRSFGGNGEGTLFYPGRPRRIGGRHPIPIESIRLKRIRDGHEDYEYLHQLEQAGLGDQARSIARELFPTASQTNVSPARFAAARRRIADVIK